MRNTFILVGCLFVASVPVSHADYLIREGHRTNYPARRDKTMEVQADDTGRINGEMTDRVVKLGTTTNDMNAKVYTNISQLVLVPIEPKDLKANLETVSPEVLKAVVAAIVKSVNARLPGTNKITAAEIRQNIKDAL